MVQSCAKKITDDCKSLLEDLRAENAIFAEALLRGSIVLSVETGLYSEFENCLSKRKAMLIYTYDYQPCP